jgi:hypothetical protein
MKIRIAQNSLRIRIKQDELIALSKGESIQVQMRFSIYDSLLIELVPWNLEILEGKSEHGKITINIPVSFVEKWPDNPRQTIEVHQSNGTSQSLYILVEQDLERA